MGTMCDVHGLTWAIRGHGNEGFKWAILYGDHVWCAWSYMGLPAHGSEGFKWVILNGDHVWCAWSYMGHTGSWERGFYMGILYGNHVRCARYCMGHTNSQKRGFWMGHPVWEPRVMCMVLHRPYGLTVTRFLNGRSCSYMGTMCDVHGLTWAIRVHGSKDFKWAIVCWANLGLHGPGLQMGMGLKMTRPVCCTCGIM